MERKTTKKTGKKHTKKASQVKGGAKLTTNTRFRQY